MNLVTRKTIVPIAILTASLSVIQPLEGLALSAYYDVTGKPTICRGFTYGVKITDTATAEECDQKTVQGIEIAYGIFAQSVPQHIRDKLTAKTQAAYTSFIYNVGMGRKNLKSGFIWLKNGKHSTMFNKLIAGDVRGSCHEFPKWIYAGNKEYNGLKRRRNMEMILCLDTVNGQ